MEVSENEDFDALQSIVTTFIDNDVATKEDEIIDTASDRLSDSFAYSKDAASYFGHGHDDF